MNIKYVTGRVRLSFVNFEKPDDTYGRYGCTLLIDKDSKDIENLEAVIEAAKKDGMDSLWKGKKPRSIESPLHDGDDVDYDGYEGNYYLSTKIYNIHEMHYFDRNNVATDCSEFYSGCYARASLEFFANNTGEPRICCKLVAVKFLADGDAFTGGHRDEESVRADFDDDFEDNLDEF